jgi:hypothetical protein
MNIYDFALYVNQDVDDTFTNEEVARWFNKAIANFNLIPPVTKFPFINMNLTVATGTDSVNEFTTSLANTTYKVDVAENTYANNTFTHNTVYDEEIGAFVDYPLSNNFMLGVMLPYVISAVKGAESSIGEKQLVMQEFMMNARQFKSSLNIKPGYLVDGEGNLELAQYKLGENVYLTDFNQAPFAGDWSKASAYKEYRIATKKDGTIVKYVDDSLVKEDIETLEEESKY